MARMTQGQSIAEAAAIAAEVERERCALKIKRLEAENARLRAFVIDLANELEGEVEARYKDTKHYPGESRRYERDMDTVWKARRALEEKGE